MRGCVGSWLKQTDSFSQVAFLSKYAVAPVVATGLLGVAVGGVAVYLISRKR